MARCVICGSSDCTHAPAIAHLDSYPFLPGGHPKVPGLAGRDFIYAPHAVTDRALGRNVYGAGDPVPMADAIKYGLVAAPAPPEPEPETKGARKDRPRPKTKQAPADDRMKRGPGEAR